MASKTMIRRLSMSRALEAAAEMHAAEVAEKLTGCFAALGGEGEPPLDFGALQNGLRATLQADREAMVAADSAHIEELRHASRRRQRRDAAIVALYQRVSRLRALVETAYGTGASQKLFAVKGVTSRNPEVLRRQAETILVRLRDESKPLPRPKLPAMAIDPAAWAAEIEPAHDELVAALREVYADRRRAESTLRRKREALDTYDRTHAAVTSLLANLYRLADLESYEERLRPTVPRGRAVEEELLEDELLAGGGEVECEGEAAGPEPARPLAFPQAGGATGDDEAADESAATPSASRTAA